MDGIYNSHDCIYKWLSASWAVKRCASPARGAGVVLQACNSCWKPLMDAVSHENACDGTAYGGAAPPAQ
jgi:hypothetical protein